MVVALLVVVLIEVASMWRLTEESERVSATVRVASKVSKGPLTG